MEKIFFGIFAVWFLVWCSLIGLGIYVAWRILAHFGIL